MLALADSRSVDSRSAENACVPRDPAMPPSVDPVSQGMLTAAPALQGVTDRGALVRCAPPPPLRHKLRHMVSLLPVRRPPYSADKADRGTCKRCAALIGGCMISMHAHVNL